MRCAKGFTLLEVLVAITIGALLVTATIQTFREINDAQLHVRGEARRDLGAEVLLDRLEHELVGTTLIVKDEEKDRLQHPWLFVAEDRLFGTNDSDSLRFVTQTPARAVQSPRYGALRMVSYEVRTAEGERLDLFRFEEPLPDQMEKEIDPAEGSPVVEDLHTFRLRFRDEEDGGWRDAWDSTDVELLDRMPGAIEVAVQLMEQTSDGELEPGKEHLRVIELPIRPLLRAAGDSDRIESQCSDGVTVAVCMRRLRKQIRGAPQPVRTAIRLKRAQVRDLCWNAASPSSTLDELKQLLASTLRGDPQDRCR
jgi:type II secretion system protein J